MAGAGVGGTAPRDRPPATLNAKNDVRFTTRRCDGVYCALQTSYPDVATLPEFAGHGGPEKRVGIRVATVTGTPRPGRLMCGATILGAAPKPVPGGSLVRRDTSITMRLLPGQPGTYGRAGKLGHPPRFRVSVSALQKIGHNLGRRHEEGATGSRNVPRSTALDKLHLPAPLYRTQGIACSPNNRSIFFY